MSDDDNELNFGDDDAPATTNTTAGNALPAQNNLRNDAHDAAMDVDDGEHIATGRGMQQNPPGRVGASAAPAAAAAGAGAGALAPSGSTVIKNADHDEAFDIEDDGDPDDNNGAAAGAAGSRNNNNNTNATGALRNNPNDAAFDAGSEPSNTPQQSPLPGRSSGASAVPALNTAIRNAPGHSKALDNNPHDMAVDLSSDGSPASSMHNNSVGRNSNSGSGLSAVNNTANKQQQQQQPQKMVSGTNHAAGLAAWGGGGGGAGAGGARAQGSLSHALPDDGDDDEEEEEEDELSDDDDELASDDGHHHNAAGASPGGASPSSAAGGGGGGGAAGGGAVGANNTPVYNPEEYAQFNKNLSQEIRDLFNHIQLFQPQPIECPTKLRPFMPDFVPCIGDIDPFLKVPRPDGKPDLLGLVTLDEPSDKQTNATVVKNHLRSTLRVAMGPPVVDMVPEAHTRPQVLDKWVKDVKSQRKLQTNVNYSKPMPDITELMQEWPEEFEALINSNVQLPPSNIDLDMLQYVKLVCTLVDIPTHSNLVESLHLLFSTYLDFRSNQHFQHQ